MRDDAPFHLLGWHPPPPGDPVPPFASPVRLRIAPPVPFPILQRPSPFHRLG